MLRAKLAEVKAQLVKDVEDAYEAVFKELEDFAAQNGVTFDRGAFRNLPSLKTGTNNFFALRSNADVSAFKQEQMKKILESKPAGTPTGGGSQPPQQPQVKRVFVKASQLCRAQKIRNIDELNKYVDSVRNNLISALGDNDELIVS